MVRVRSRVQSPSSAPYLFTSTAQSVKIFKLMKRLYKSNTDKKWDGVCGGIAEYYDVDPTLVRAFYAFITVLSGVIPGLLAYIALSWIMPRKKEARNG